MFGQRDPLVTPTVFCLVTFIEDRFAGLKCSMKSQHAKGQWTPITKAAQRN